MTRINIIEEDGLRIRNIIRRQIMFEKLGWHGLMCVSICVIGGAAMLFL